MTNTFKDHFSGYADSYQKFRPDYPDEMFKHFASISPATDIAWDCATGNGQAALSLAKYFSRVIATDASEQQISHAIPAQNIEYQIVNAEQSQLPSHSTDLLCVAQALHWFDTRKFFKEAKRVLKPNGIIAIWWYGLLTVDPAADTVINKLYQDILTEYWPEERKIIENAYQDISFPFQEFYCPEFVMKVNWTLPMLLGYLSTWSAVRQFIKVHNRSPIDDIYFPLLEAWGDPDKARDICWRLTPKTGKFTV